MSRDEMVWTRLHLPRPLEESRVLGLLLALASDRRSPNLVFELRANPSGVVHLLGTSVTAVQGVKRLLRDQLPHVAVQEAPERPSVDEVGRMELRPRQVPLRIDNAEAVARALLSAAAVRLRHGECLVVQLVLGRHRPPRPVSPSEPSPHQDWWTPLTSGVRMASSEERRALRTIAHDRTH